MNSDAYAKYRFDLWPIIEKWYREKYGINGRLGFMHAEDIREWLGLNGYDSRMHSSELEYYAPDWSTLRYYIISTHGKTCEVCGKDVSTKYGGDEGEIDHIKPIALGGLEFDSNNLRVTCKKCNTKNRPNTTRRLYLGPKQAKLTGKAPEKKVKKKPVREERAKITCLVCGWTWEKPCSFTFEDEKDFYLNYKPKCSKCGHHPGKWKIEEILEVTLPLDEYQKDLFSLAGDK